MPNYKMVNADRLDGAMLETAKAIREKGGTEELIAWNKSTGYKEAIEAIKAGGGLNFEVVGGTVQPESPKEVTIWVNTAQEITGWAFKKDEPSQPVNGMVWFGVDTSSQLSFSVVEDAEVMEYMIGAKQYVSEQWVQRDVLVYVDGEWKAAILDLIKNAVINENASNWVSVAKSIDGSSGTAKAWSVSQGEDYITLTQSTKWACGLYYTETPIDLSSYSTLFFEGYPTTTSTTSTDWTKLCVYSAIDSSSAMANVKASVSLVGDNAVCTKSIDINDLDGLYYIGFYGYGEGQTIRIKNIYLK